ncbi:hypothetical protein KOR34_17970 [Posidoniimonas corsicana]|uniref:Uncharacterized protein n=1 Tax=Posidoniimonas corsicana TaxID=1938618 RepID=A0A5C5VGS8_9BACT|nr:hypothetical protein KOR34_17970 [Posidoniimonas corsicana]
MLTKAPWFPRGLVCWWGIDSHLELELRRRFTPERFCETAVTIAGHQSGLGRSADSNQAGCLWRFTVKI